jgi:hypothetical protein
MRSKPAPPDLVFKPRGQWHTFWNPGDVPTRVLEIISPASLEEFFRLVDASEAEQDPHKIAEWPRRRRHRSSSDRSAC